VRQAFSKKYTKLVDLAKTMRDEARNWRRDQFQERATRNWQYFVGKQWEGTTMSSRKSKLTVNHCARLVRTTLPRLTDARPTMAIHAREPGDLESAKIADALFQFKWDQMHMDVKRSLTYFYALIFGIAWFKPRINPHIDRLSIGDKLGDLAVDTPDPWHVMPDPNATWSMYPYEAIERAQYVVYEFPINIRRLQSRVRELAENPEVARDAGLVEGAVQYVEELKGGEASERPPWSREVLLSEAGVAIETVPASGQTGSSQIYTPSSTKTGPEETSELMLSEVWLRDPDYENPMVLTFCNEFALQIRESPLEHNQLPFIPVIINPLPGRLVGYGVLDDVIPLQDEINKRRSQIMDILNWVKGPGVLRDTGALVEGEEVVLTEGFDIELTPGKRFEIWSPKGMVPNDLWASADKAVADLDEISMVGQQPELKAGTPNVALETVTESQLLPIRQMERWNNASFVELGQQCWSIMQQLYRDSGYVIRVVGEAAAREPRYFKGDDIRGQFDFEWIPNSAITLRRQLWYKQLTDLKGLGAPIPWDAIIDVTDLPDKEGIKAIMKEEEMRQQQMMEAQMALGAEEGTPAAPPGPAPPM
jgi:hypothetical protein